ncbi:Rho GTPase-activating protein 9 [Gaertneriomyces sp. JEL0708]|nr:Rho GTPase-activating protein 9 [Gaertneriomyces sp. JEL0708]
MAQVASSNSLAPLSGGQWYGDDLENVLFAQANWAYSAIEDNEISFNAGDLIQVLEECNKDWYEGKLANGAVGFFPANRVTVLGKGRTALALSDSTVRDDSAPAFRLATYTSQASPPPIKELSPAASAAQLSVENRTGGAVTNAASNKSTSPWQIARDEHGGNYYWNVTTGEVRWTEPESGKQDIANATPRALIDQLGDKLNDVTIAPSTGAAHPPRLNMQHSSESQSTCADDGSTQVSPTMKDSPGHSPIDEDGILQTLECVPPEIIRREGWLLMKSKAPNAKEAKKGSWTQYWVVICVGFFIAFKEEPAKNKRRFDRLNTPAHVIRLNCINIDAVGKDQTKKKNAFCLATDGGETWLLQPVREAEIHEWMDTIKEASRERSTTNEYEYASSRLFSIRSDEPTELVLSRVRSQKEDSKKGRSRRATASTPSGDEEKADKKGRSRRPTVNSGDEPGAAKSRRPTTSKSSTAEQDDFEGRKSTIKSKLGAFFNKRPTMEKLKEQGIIRDEDQVFGGHLPDLISPMSHKHIPRIVEACVTEVDKRGLQSQGIYRLSGNASNVQKIRLQYNESSTADLSEEPDINVIASLLKLYFRELLDPLIPFGFYDRFVAAAKVEDYDTRLIEIKNLVQALPKHNYDTLEYVIRHLRRVADHSEENKMEPANLAIVFGPTLIRPPEDAQTAYMNMMNMTYQNQLIECILTQTEWIFDGSAS